MDVPMVTGISLKSQPLSGLAETDANGQCNGDKRAALLHREHIVRWAQTRLVLPVNGPLKLSH
jgi:hypothetical protein